MPTRIKTIKQLKAVSDKGHNDFFIALAGGLVRSSKYIQWEKGSKLFLITNKIDDTEQNLLEKELFDVEKTNIGKAMKLGALFAY